MNDRRLYPSAALHGQVAHEIGRQIVSGAIAEGDYLPREAELSERFSVSRQAIREALKVLAAKGLVASRRRAGTHVMPRATWHLLDPDVMAWHPSMDLSPDFLNDLIELRRLIEPAAARFAAERGKPDKVAAIGAAVEKMRRTIEDREAFYAADAEFHFAMFAASGNTLIDRLSTILALVLESSFRVQAPTGPISPSLVDAHAAVYQAIVDGDADKAEDGIETILATANDALARLKAARQRRATVAER